MQHKQENYKAWMGGALLAVFLFCAGSPALSAGITGSAKPDPILTGGPAGPCDPQTGSADYVPGTDVNGNPVASADLDKAPVPVPGQIAIPLKAQSAAAPAYVQADGKALASLLNPPAACPQPRH